MKMMLAKSKFMTIILSIILLTLAGCTISNKGQSESAGEQQKAAVKQPSENDLISKALNNTYKIDGYDQYVTLVNGKSVATSNSSLSVVLPINTKPVAGKLNIGNQTISGAALLLAVNGGGSGVFMYVAASFTNDEGENIGTNAVGIGDRLVPQTIKIEDGNIVVDYLDRNQGENFATKPSVNKTKKFTIRENTLTEI